MVVMESETNFNDTYCIPSRFENDICNGSVHCSMLLEK